MQFAIATMAPIVAMIGSIVAMMGLAIQLRRSFIGLQTQSLLELERRFYSAEMRATRRTAARKLLSGTPVNEELEDVLDFLHGVVTLIDHRVIDHKVATEFYKYWLARYWLAAKAYVEQLRKDDDLITYRKVQQHAEKITRAATGVNFSPAAMRLFLLKEAGSEQEDTQQQPPLSR